ncbi:MAG: S1 RNA-binding domain-containing protein [Chloroflexi bacterium]|nr:S1 RNA-binding domain-containing protein [Chloroflexota bacterium]
MSELLDSMKPVKPLRRGDVVEGVVMRADPDGIFINVGAKAEGVVPPGEMKTLGADARKEINIGDEIVTFVVRSETAEEGAILSIDRAVGEQGWRVLEVAMESGELIHGTILGFNRGGAIVEAEGVQGFVPISQLVSVSKAHFRETQREEKPEAAAPTASSAEDATDAQQADAAFGEAPVAAPEPQTPAAPERDPRDDEIGKVLKMKVLEVNRGRNRAIFSERQAVQERRDEQKARLIEELTEGEVRKGRVTGLSSFGAFVDLGGADGLIHISELSWDQVNTPDEVVKVGDELDVYVLRVDSDNRRIALSLRRLKPEPWETINDRYNVEDIVDATVTKLTNFGAFARIEGSVEGLIHISELTPRMIAHPREVVTEGQAVRVKILRIEPDRKRLGLSLRQAEEKEGTYSPYVDESEKRDEVKSNALPPEVVVEPELEDIRAEETAVVAEEETPSEDSAPEPEAVPMEEPEAADEETPVADPTPDSEEASTVENEATEEQADESGAGKVEEADET